MFARKQQKLVHVAAKESQHVRPFVIPRPFQPANIFFEQWLFRILAALEHGYRQGRNWPKERGEDIRMVNPNILYFTFEYKVNIRAHVEVTI